MSRKVFQAAHARGAGGGAVGAGGGGKEGGWFWFDVRRTSQRVESAAGLVQENRRVPVEERGRQTLEENRAYAMFIIKTKYYVVKDCT